MSADKTEAQKKNTILGDFELRRKLGQGGMGAVYLAHQLSLDRDCALKVMAKELANKPGFVDRFVREARSMAKIDHPNVVSCYAVGNDKGMHYVAMELIDGRSMQDWLNDLGQLSVPDAVLVTVLCGEALHYAHELNMVHRDIKPDNILVTKKGIVKVADLGLAKAIDEEDLALTQSGTGLGTPHYMAPEQARNAKHVDRRCDVYALGCTLYHFLTGKTPFSGGSLVELITNKERGTFSPAHRVRSEVPERLSLMVDKAMSKDAAHRYQTCEEFIKDLESLQLTADALSFIDETQRVTVRRSSGPSSSVRTQTIPGHQTLPQNSPASGSTSTKQRSRTRGSDWYVKYSGSNGKLKVGKMSTSQILTALKTDKLNQTAQASQQSKGPFLPLAQIPIFEDEARKLLTRQRSQNRDQQIAKQYEKLAKQYDRRKIWRFFGRLVEGTFGIVGLIIWLVVALALIGAMIYFIPILFNLVAENLGLNDAAK